MSRIERERKRRLFVDLLVGAALFVPGMMFIGAIMPSWFDPNADFTFKLLGVGGFLFALPGAGMLIVGIDRYWGKSRRSLAVGAFFISIVCSLVAVFILLFVL